VVLAENSAASAEMQLVADLLAAIALPLVAFKKVANAVAA
jgi:hypothetical protein